MYYEPLSVTSLLGIPCSSKTDFRCAMTAEDWMLVSLLTQETYFSSQRLTSSWHCSRRICQILRYAMASVAHHEAAKVP